MASGMNLTGFGGAGQRFDRFLQNLNVAVVLIATHFAEGVNEFFEILGIALLTLQEAFNVGGYLLTL